MQHPENRKATVSDTNKVMCPECDTPNDENAPFCENCGYRLRRPGTVREGHPSVTREQIEANRQGQTLPDTEPERRPAPVARTSENTTRPESIPAIKVAEDEPGSTVLEGLEPVDRSRDSSSSITPIPVHSSDSIIIAGPHEANSGSSLLWALAWIVSTGLLMLVTYYMTAQSNQTNTIEVRAVQKRIAVPAGPFLRGLNEQVRGFILMTCQKLADDTADCEESKLLTGEYPQESVELPAFEIDALEVSRSEYQKCVAAGDCAEVDGRDCKVHTTQGIQPGMRVPKAAMAKNMPMSCVTRKEAQAYCEFVEGSLPTHDQWEKAARGTKGKLFPWGDGWISDTANWGEIDILKTAVSGKLDGYEWSAPPGSYDEGASTYGAFDMAGNVSEWVQGDDPLKGHVRGGSWASTPFELRATARLEMGAEERRADVGLRCVYPAKN